MFKRSENFKQISHISSLVTNGTDHVTNSRAHVMSHDHYLTVT